MGIKEKYKKLSIPTKAGLWLVICSFLQKAIVSLTMPIFTRLMSTEEYGQFAFYTSVVSVLTIVATLNINGIVVTKGISKYYDKSNEFISVVQFISSCAVLITLAIYLLNIDYWNNILGFSTFIVLIMFLQMLFSPAFEIWTACQRFKFEYKKIVRFTLYYVISYSIIGIMSVYFAKDKGAARILAFVMVQVIFYSFLYVSNWNKERIVWNKEYFKFTLNFNLPLIPHGLANQILAKSDIFMINYLVGTSQAGIYSLGYSVALLFTILTTSINNVYVPWLFQNLKSEKYDEIKKVTNILLFGLTIIVSLMLLVVPELISIFATNEYQYAVYVVPPVTIGIYFTFIYTLFVNIELFLEKTKLIMCGSIIVALFNIGLNIIFIPKFGFIAAAYTTLVSYILYSLIHYICASVFCKKYMNLTEIYDIKFILGISIVQFIIMFLFQGLYNVRGVRYILIIIFIVVILLKRSTIENVFKNILRK